ncbi:hydroxymethylglutaryl-CoA lyase [Streptomyces antnestii]|uniref:Hydroxymethylglutaryl-CoA lyase n=1 Tax=Streptomyces antnestii TaxID=2494256 RepID=A0A437PLF2_9ACTN|nr:hydroxymethylglutaryl-CoA lyase [Streptomyces sp. San01]RVU22854.1 hydroxymethylglutaryl-CoA lyase [Streptomyces sp. San01]
MTAPVQITDVFLRDGLQDEPVFVPVHDRLSIAEALTAAGVRSLEVASVVNPARVPQMAGADELIAALPPGGPARHSVLALNGRGVERAVAAGAREINVAVSAGQSHSRANAGRTTEQALDELAAAIGKAAADHPEITFYGAVSTAFNCPFDGEIRPDRLGAIVGRFTEMRVARIGLADTLGTAPTTQVVRALKAVRSAFPDAVLSLHLHNALGQALATVDAALELGVTHFDSAVGGYGGCPFAPGAHGNLDTRELVAHLHASGVITGIDEGTLAEAFALVRARLARAEPVTS